MSRPLPFQFGAAGDPVFWIVAGGLLALIAVAVLLEYRRRRKSRRANIAAEREFVNEIAAEKGLDEDETRALFRLIDGHFPETPLAVVKDRAIFDRAVQQEIEAIESVNDEQRLRHAGLVLRAVREKLEFSYVPMGQRIWSSRELHEGQTAWLARREESAEWYEGMVSAVDEAFLHVTLRKPQGRAHMPFLKDELVRCRLWREDDARYLLTLRLASCSGEPAACLLRHTSDLDRMQAREYYRIRYTQTAHLNLLDSSKTPDSETLEHAAIVAQWPTHFVSLSAGGFAVIGNNSLPVDAPVRIKIQLPDEDPFNAVACTVGCEPVPGNRYLIRAKFTDITEEKRDLIARYVTLRQHPHLVQAGEQPNQERRG